ncbi:MAG: hypothetical protein V3W41_00655 [Planctomycetota bacterium]
MRIVLFLAIGTLGCALPASRHRSEASSGTTEVTPNWSQHAQRRHVPAELRDILENADDYELFAIYPHRPRPDEIPAADRQMHGFRVIGRTPVSKATGLSALSVIYQGVRDEHYPRAKCFNPRHALRARRGQQWVDLVICYQCQRIFAYDETGERWEISTAPEVRPALDRIYEEQGLKIDPS